MNKLLLSSLAVAVLTVVAYHSARVLDVDETNAAIGVIGLAAAALAAAGIGLAASAASAALAATSAAALAVAALAVAAFAVAAALAAAAFAVAALAAAALAAAACAAFAFAAACAVAFAAYADEIGLKRRWALAVAAATSLSVFGGLHWSAPWLALGLLAAALAGLWLAGRRWPSAFAQARPQA